MKKLYVGSLYQDCDREQLKIIFSKAGKIRSIKMVIDPASKIFKGYAFIQMATEEEAKLAIRKFNGFSLGGRRMIVSIAQPKRR
jgi:RNA recognition motif-containing protein